MKSAILLLSLVSMIAAGCSTPSASSGSGNEQLPSASDQVSALAPAPAGTSNDARPAGDVSGEWRWICCDGRYRGEMQLRQENGKITGRLFDENDTVGGTVEGDIRGNKILFARTWGDDFRQDYTLTLSADGKKLEGEIEGYRDESVGNHFEATRE